MKRFIGLITVMTKMTLAQPTIVDVEANSIFIPVGYDANDEIELVVDGFLPTTCHRVHSPEIRYDKETRTFMIQPRAALFTGTCAPVAVPYTRVVRLGLLENGEYAVTTRNGRQFGTIVVQSTLPQQAIDDFLYLPVETSYIYVVQPGKFKASMQARFSNTCMRLKTIVGPKVTGKTIQVMPIMEIAERDPEGKPCENKIWTKEYTFDLPKLFPGRYLLHIRSMNGQSVNEVFETHWN